jgi:hypothetical protein
MVSYRQICKMLSHNKLSTSAYSDTCPFHFAKGKEKKKDSCYPFLPVRTAEKLYKAYASQKKSGNIILDNKIGTV